MMYLYPLAMSFLGEKHCNMFNANKEFVLYCIVLFAKKVEGKNWFNFVATEWIFLKFCISLSLTHSNSVKEIQIFFIY